jgi:hypothetical protein
MSETSVHINDHATPKAPNVEAIRTIEDPHQFIVAFRSSPRYTGGYEKFFEGKSPASDVTEEEKHRAFEESELAKTAILSFAQKDAHLSYKREFYDEETRKSVDEYIAATRDLFKMTRNGSRDEIISADALRSGYHQSLAYTLTEKGITPNQKMGKAFARLILIDKGLDTFESAAVPDSDRIKRLLGAVMH